MANLKSKIKGGFTLSELIIVISIIGVITAIASNTYRNQRVQVEFTDSLTTVVSMIKTARNYAVTSRMAYDGGELSVPPEGYGIYINSNTGEFILFANVGSDPNAYDGSNDDVIEEEYTLPNNTVFEDMLSDSCDGSSGVDEVVIIFRPPLADASIIDGVGDTMNTLYMRLSRAGSPAGVYKCIHMNRTAGFPEIDL
ncbi:prepilin-type N-terminal cleavage/methylation domain-containing protein [Patescibacteria group bacterium]|nr:prepilin-type N-terminal cleavage/methylation domain-containing protein [Patescibacteria group bacterium]MBU1683815.1 prepilin-type N-terminal cleavage/methylation domain-containing protein [Patescibacteria group bacterium]MBU1935131.1 prepilin-type N-terminal cleavage/methylation domain-containing protein [Patescibacteria group bacterium]